MITLKVYEREDNTFGIRTENDADKSVTLGEEVYETSAEAESAISELSKGEEGEAEKDTNSDVEKPADATNQQGPAQPTTDAANPPATPEKTYKVLKADGVTVIINGEKEVIATGETFVSIGQDAIDSVAPLLESGDIEEVVA